MKKLLIGIDLAIMALSGCTAPRNNVLGCYTISDYSHRIGVWYNYSTVDWAQLDTLYYRPYNCDWPDEYVRETGDNHISEVDGQVWHLLQNARTKCHQDNLPLRASLTEEQRAQLDHIEASFDSVFVHYMRGDYYLRAMVDAYQDVMPGVIDELK